MNTTSILDRRMVLVLNRAWQAISTRTVADAIGQIMSGSMTPLDIGEEGTMIPVRGWKAWMELPVREQDEFVRTVRGPVRAPTVIVSARYGQVPHKRPRFSARSVKERDGNRCQYTGRVLKPGEGNLDHVIPRSRGGGTDFGNVVYSCREVNHRKGDRTPEEAGLRLLRAPKVPAAVPVTILLRNEANVRDWNLFLPVTEAAG